MMLAACLLLTCLQAICSGEYYQQELAPKNLRMYYYARRMQPAFHERMQFAVKPSFTRPYMMYIPKPYVVEVPKPVPYVKLSVPQQYHFGKRLPHPYKIEKPLYLHQLPTSLDTKVPLDFHNPEESPVSVTVEKQVLLPVNLSDEKGIESKEPSAYVSIPEEVTSHLKLAMNKEQYLLSEFEKESLLKQINANSFSQDGLKSQFALHDNHKLYSSATGPKGWSSESKTVLEPIVVPEESKKWANFNGSEWVPRFKITDTKTSSIDNYKFIKPDKENFKISEAKFPIQDLSLSQDLFKYVLESKKKSEKNKFFTSPAITPVASHKRIPFEQSFLNEQPLKQSFEVPSSQTYQFYNIDSGNVIKPEALTSNIGITEVGTDEKEENGSSHQWATSKINHKDIFKTNSEETEPNLKWVLAQESYSNQNEPTIKWMKNSEHYVVRTEPVEKLSEDKGKYEGQKEVTQQWSTQDHLQAQYQEEPGKKWTNGHGQYIIQNESDNLHAQQKDQSEANIDWKNSRDQYIKQNKPTQQMSITEDTQYTSHKRLTPFSIQEEQVTKISDDNFKNKKAYSSQHYNMLSHQYGTENKDLQPQKYDQQNEKYFHFSQQLEGNFKPLIPSQSQIYYGYQIPHSENQPHSQHFIKRQPSNQKEQDESYYKNLHRFRNTAEQSSVKQKNDQHLNGEREVFHRQPIAIVNTENTEPTSHQQYFPTHQYYHQSKSVPPKTRDGYQGEGSSVHTHPQYKYTTRDGDQWQQTSQTIYQGNIEAVNQKELPSIDNKTISRQPEYSGIFGHKRRHRQPSRSESDLPDQNVRSNRVSVTNTTEESTTSILPSSTTSQPRRKHRRKQKRRNQETTISPTEN